MGVLAPRTYNATGTRIAQAAPNGSLRSAAVSLVIYGP